MACSLSRKFFNNLIKRKGIGEQTGFCHLVEELIGLTCNERFTEAAEVAMLSEALKTSYEEATKVLPSKQTITKTTVMNKVHGIADEIPDKVYESPKSVPYLYIEADEDHVAEHTAVRLMKMKIRRRKSSPCVSMSLATGEQ